MHSLRPRSVRLLWVDAGRVVDHVDLLGRVELGTDGPEVVNGTLRSPPVGTLAFGQRRDVR